MKFDEIEELNSSNKYLKSVASCFLINNSSTSIGLKNTFNSNIETNKILI